MHRYQLSTVLDMNHFPHERYRMSSEWETLVISSYHKVSGPKNDGRIHLPRNIVNKPLKNN